MSKPIRVLIVEDNMLARIALRSVIDARPDMSIEAETGRGDEALALYRKVLPDVTVLDLRLPGRSGLEVIRDIRSEFPSARILVLSNYEGSEDIYRAIQAGARAYLTKDTSTDELVTAILSVHRGVRFLPSPVACRMAERIPCSDLTARETQVLQHLVQSFSTEEIAHDLSISEKTVRIHVSAIFQKLHVRSRSEAVLEALHRGIVHIE